MAERRLPAPDTREENRWSDGPPLPRWALWLMLPGILAPLLVLVFIVTSESAHDSDRCPYRELTRKELAAGVSVVEEVRSCIGDIEEHRYTLLRGTRVHLLGERRFERAAFAPDRYRWKASISDQGEVQVVIQNAGHADLLLREGTPKERAEGISH
jgi:uncharacterized protein involved in tolerance to divalent cations